MQRELLGRLTHSVCCRVDGLVTTEAGGTLAGLSDEAMDYAMALYVGDTGAQPKLFYAAYLRTVDVAIRERWKLPRGEESGEEMLRKLTLVALFELMHGKPCQNCDGEGFVGVNVCVCCEGTGKACLPCVAIARAVGRSEKQFHEVWKPRYRLVVRELWWWQVGLEGDLTAVLGRGKAPAG
jgi:hypothetical protein